jgi:Ser/Thr protein kinase RdoA (MazF antagonist)
MKPEDVLHNWDIPHLTSAHLKKANSGLLNKTFLIRAGTSENELFVLQCVHPAVSMDGAMNNYFHVTQFLREQGLVTQEYLPTISGALWTEVENNWRWRMLRGVEGEVYEKTTDPKLAEEAGKLLGQTDIVLATYPKPLEPGRKSFAYTLEIEKLNQYQNKFEADGDKQIREASDLLRATLPKLLLPDDLPKSIIHADPKTSNFIFTPQGKGICMIDFDTIQSLSPLYEIGDAIRSWCGQEEDNPNNTFNTAVFHAFLQGYLDNSKGLLSEREQSLIPQAAQLIMLGLATRFMNDYIDDTYFGWDSTKYDSRKAHNKARALGQISLYKSFLKSS